MAISSGFDVTAAAARARWSTVVAREALAAWSASGLSRRELAEKHGLQEQRLYNWERRLAEPHTTAEVQLREVTLPAVGVDSRLEVVLPNGTVLRIPSSFDTKTLARVVEVLGPVRVTARAV